MVTIAKVAQNILVMRMRIKKNENNILFKTEDLREKMIFHDIKWRNLTF